jgi:hypothetical protein
MEVGSFEKGLNARSGRKFDLGKFSGAPITRAPNSDKIGVVRGTAKVKRHNKHILG